MLKRFAILFTFVLAISYFSPSIFAQNEGLELSKTTIIIPCPPSSADRAECKDDSSIKVEVGILSKVKNLKYRYSITGGRIVGDGRKIEWDLLGVPPGTYTITTTIEGENNFRKVFSKQITVAICSTCISDCFCHNLHVNGKLEENLKERIINFTASLTGGSQTRVKYKWKISAGKIAEGQGTPFIKVSAKKIKAKSITAMLEIDGDLCFDCAKTAETTVVIN